MTCLLLLCTCCFVSLPKIKEVTCLIFDRCEVELETKLKLELELSEIRKRAKLRFNLRSTKFKI